MHHIKVFEACVHELSRLPGIGRKTATRLALHILKMKPENVRRLSDSITELKEKTRFCSQCGAISEGELCGVCSSNTRRKDIICVVEEAKDIFFIEHTGQYNGIYHVLGGKISPLDGVGPEDLSFARLMERVEKNAAKEVIIATNPDTDGETTAIYIGRILKKFNNLKITKLASGIPIGSHIEYADEITVLRALEGRREI
ncbi:MAG: recombination protein RecR [Deferribacterales bacterium]|nr:recombination protein RecR [Deferribacterales bacterium]